MQRDGVCLIAWEHHAIPVPAKQRSRLMIGSSMCRLAEMERASVRCRLGVRPARTRLVFHADAGESASRRPAEADEGQMTRLTLSFSLSPKGCLDCRCPMDFLKARSPSDVWLKPSRGPGETQYHLHFSIKIGGQPWDVALNVGTDDDDNSLLNSSSHSTSIIRSPRRWPRRKPDRTTSPARARCRRSISCAATS